LVLSGANTYSGSTTISAGRLTLGAANTIASSSSVIMAGGTLDPDGFHHAMTATTLGLTASSILDYSSGAAEIDFANSSGVAWTSGMTLNLVSTGGGNWNNSSDYLEVGTATGLTSGQLAEIEFNGTDLGDAGITSQGYIIDTAQIPEPSTVVLSLLGGLGLLWNIRRRAV
jgi:fibronectin-binding autotransporter adhesin